MSKPIGIQLYTVRDALSHDYEGTVRKIAEYGYAGVEPASMFGSGVEWAVDLFRSLGLQVPSAHVGIPEGDPGSTFETLHRHGSTYYVVPWLPPEQFRDRDSILRICDRMNAFNSRARAEGFTLAYHNHWFEYESVGNTYGYRIMHENLDPTVMYEIDTYWVQTAGCDPVAVIQEFDDRVPLLHIKDGPRVLDAAMVAVGEGKMNFAPIIEAAAHAEWLFVEIDRCDTDVMDAVARSIRYLTDEGLGHGK